LVEACPIESDATIVHGDFRLDNTILDSSDPDKIAAVVDWEMATLGDPLADLGLLLVYWDPICAPVLPDGHTTTANVGFPSISEMAQLYSAMTGRPLGDLNFYRALGYYKLAVIAEGIDNRF
jgi:aminoglycoside phosphotransferase (APT) family kinase protein